MKAYQDIELWDYHLSKIDYWKNELNFDGQGEMHASSVTTSKGLMGKNSIDSMLPC